MSTMTEAEDSSTIPSNETPTATLDNEAESLFGSMNTRIADAFAERIQAAATEGVESLPLLSDKEKAQSLIETIEQTYLDRVDIMETYARNNIFTVSLYKPRRRQRILQACLQDLPLNDKLSIGEADEGKQQGEEAYPEYPSKDEIPTPQETAALQSELCDLKDRLDAARLRRNTLLAKQKSLESAIAVSNAAVQSLAVVSNDVRGPVAKALSNGKSMQELTKEGKELIQQLDDSKRERENDCDENNGFIPATKLNAKKKRMSMEEEYKHDRQVLQAKDVDSLQALRTILKQK